MRVLTHSSIEAKGLISIAEAEEHVSQVIVFCIPIEKLEAKRMRNLIDFDQFFRGGISTRIVDGKRFSIINLTYKRAISSNREPHLLPKFEAYIKGHTIEFYLSSLNFASANRQQLDIGYFYSGDRLARDLRDKRLVILEPNWRQLDDLFLENKILFTDWN